MATRRVHKKKLETAEARKHWLGVRFRRPELLELALTHSSFTNEARAGESTADSHPLSPVGNDPGTDNEQMEFLGDAVLGLLVSDALYREFPHCDEGALTRLRASLVGRPHLAAVAAAMQLGERLRVGRSAELNGVASKPAVLADAVEAVIAAVYLDSGLEAARTAVDEWVIAPQREALHEAMDGADRGALRDAKSLLQERVQAGGLGRLRYIDTERSGPAHQLRFTVEARIEQGDDSRLLSSAEGSSKKEAQQLAAQRALDGWALHQAATAVDGAA